MFVDRRLDLDTGLIFVSDSENEESTMPFNPTFTIRGSDLKGRTSYFYASSSQPGHSTSLMHPISE